MIHVRAAAKTLGGDVQNRNSFLVPGPGHSGRDRSLSVTFDNDAPEGFWVHSFAGDNPLECRDHVRDALGLPGWRPAARQIAAKPKITKTQDDGQRINAALSLWRQAGDPHDTIIEKYLQSRGLSLKFIGGDIRFHGALKFEGRTAAGMVALMRDTLTNEPCGIHRTFIDPQGHKIGRKMLGRARGAAVKLSGNETVTDGLGIAEGIETALAVLKTGWNPVWACLSAGGISAFPDLSGIESLTIFSDPDSAGMDAAQKCARRWLEAGKEAFIHRPKNNSHDWNDELEGVK